jgi:glycosyltransferase involved in cell wall biosynthesis
MREVCNRLEVIPRADTSKGTLRFKAEAAAHLFRRLPYAVGKYRSAAYRKIVQHLLDRRSFDLVVCDFLFPAVNLPARLPCSAVIFTHNVESEIWRRHAETARGPIARALLAQQWRRMLRFEGRTLSRFDLVLAVSEADRQTFGRLYPGALRAPAHVVQTGVDTTYFSPAAVPAESGQPGEAQNEATRRAHLVFTGSMDWLPNEDGMLYFVRDILPRIRESEPDATLSIIGRAPTPAVKQLAEQAGIEVTGRVDDVRPHIAAGAVYVVPLRIGGGTRLKIFEAMAMGKAVVSTTVGAEGLPVTSGRDVVIADDPADFARAVVGLIRDAGTRRRIEAEARRVVVERYDWSAVAQDFEHALTHSRALQEAGRSGEPFLKSKELVNS